MNTLMDDDDHDDLDRNDRELTLSTGTILGIFFGLVLLCGLFFGFGYKMGSHKPMTAQAATADNSPSPATDFGGFKPAAGSPAGSTAAPVASPAPEPPRTAPAADPSSNAAKPVGDAPVVHANPPATAITAPAGVTAPATPIPPGSFIVQIAAVSHQEDAELLVNALRAKGYPVSAHTEPQDKFFHIQVGPFTDRKDADAAKQRLMADGYSPIVK
jgi:DedD protein